MESLLKHASGIYLFDYLGLIVAVSLLECIIPRRPASDSLRTRWLGNFGITILDMILVRSLFRSLNLGMAILAAERGWGLFNHVHLPLWTELAIVVVFFDLVNYAQHYMFHRFTVLWRIHRAHHTDQDYDFSTGLRFHPFESILTTATNVAAVALLGAPPVAVLISQIITMSQTLIEHGNFRIPPRLDRVLRLLIVTPSTHRIHHSRDLRQSRSNLANTFSWWDRLFGTYIDASEVIPEQLIFGVAEFQDRKHLAVHWILAQPFLREIPEDGQQIIEPMLGENRTGS